MYVSTRKLGMQKCAAVASVIVIAACSEGWGDSSHIAGDSPHVDHVTELSWVEEVRIGSVEDPEAGFSSIGQIQVLENGDIYVLDSQAREVRVFDADGQRVRVLGGSGQGPGEFSMPTLMGFLGDTLWVSDMLDRRLTWFGPEGEVLFTTPAPRVSFDPIGTGVSLILTPRVPRSDGFIESGMSETHVRGGGTGEAYQYPVLLFDRDGEVVDTLRWETVTDPPLTVQVGQSWVFAPYLNPRGAMGATFSDGRAIIDWSVSGDGTRGEIDILRANSEGDTVYHQRLGYTPIEVPAEVLDSLIAPRLPRDPSASTPEIERVLRAVIQLPEHRPPVRTAFSGADGTLWLQLNTPSPAGSDWIVFGGDGSALGRLTLPPRLRVRHSAYPVAWAVDTDEFNIPSLVKLRFD